MVPTDTMFGRFAAWCACAERGLTAADAVATGVIMAGDGLLFIPHPPVASACPRTYPDDVGASAWWSLAGGDRPSHGGAAGLPPELTWQTLLTGWTFAWIPALLVVASGTAYLVGVRRMYARGDGWSPWRTLAFVGGGLGSLVIATQSGLASYDTTLLWVHMVQHMILAMVAPVFLALGAPITLALRTLPLRPRRGLLAAIHSWPARILAFPVVAGILFVATPFVLYFTPLYEATLRHAWLHELNHMHFLIVGCLWFWPLLGLDPMPNRLPYGFRMICAFVVLPFHAFLGIAIMSASTVLAGDWYYSLGRPWGPSPIDDQQIAGGVLWASGDLIALLVVGIIFVQWMQDSEREAKREDRRLDALEAAAAREAARTAEPGL
jgi:cytochrome c oxidase assembly factor CtaG